MSSKEETEHKYADIIHMTRPTDPDVLRRHPPMPVSERAKIFQPFSALRGHSEVLEDEAVRHTHDFS